MIWAFEVEGFTERGEPFALAIPVRADVAEGEILGLVGRVVARRLPGSKVVKVERRRPAVLVSLEEVEALGREDGPDDQLRLFTDEED